MNTIIHIPSTTFIFTFGMSLRTVSHFILVNGGLIVDDEVLTSSFCDVEKV